MPGILIPLITLSTSCNQTKEKNKTNMENQVIEITYFKPKAEVSKEVFKARNIRVGTEYAAKQKGFISRETGVNDDGTWVLIVHWETLEDSQASMNKFMKEPSVTDFNAMIEPGSFKMDVYTSKALLIK